MGIFQKIMLFSEIWVKKIRVNQGVGIENDPLQTQYLWPRKLCSCEGLPYLKVFQALNLKSLAVCTVLT